MRILVLVAVSFALAACSSTGPKKLAVCDGKHLRTANPYGTVLAPPVEGTATPSADGTQAKPKTLSSAAPPKSFGSCA